MSRGINKVILVGHLGADPESRAMPNGKTVCNLRLATSEQWKTDGEKQERTEWHSIVVFEKLAEIIAEYARKGSQLYVEGSLRTRKWQDKEGKDRYTTEIVARDIQMLSRAPEGSSAPQKQGSEQRMWGQKLPVGGTIEGNLARASTGEDPDDEIPF